MAPTSSSKTTISCYSLFCLCRIVASVSQPLQLKRLSNLMPFIIISHLIFLPPHSSACEPPASYLYLEIQPKGPDYRAALAYMATLPSSEEEEPAEYVSLSKSITNDPSYNLRPTQIARDAFQGARLTWIKAGDCLLIRLHPQELSVDLGAYLKQVISIGNEIKPADGPKTRRWRWGLLLNDLKKVKATVRIVEVILGPLLGGNWEIGIDIIKALVEFLDAFF